MKLAYLIRLSCQLVVVLSLLVEVREGFAADKLIGFHSARTMSQAMP